MHSPDKPVARSGYMMRLSVCAGCREQDIEDIKKEMKQLEGKAGSMSEEAHAMASRQLLMKLYRATGPAKVAAARDHITMLLEQGPRPLCPLVPYSSSHHKSPRTSACGQAAHAGLNRAAERPARAPRCLLARK